MIAALADLFLPGADRASTPMELARVFAHRQGFGSGLVVGAFLGAVVVGFILSGAS